MRKLFLPLLFCLVAGNAGAQWKPAGDHIKTPSRLVNPASGGNHYPVGDMLDLHNYPQPGLYLYDAQRATVLGEYGGIGLPVEGHLWTNEKTGATCNLRIRRK
ncbi:MAG: hypothetical protein AB7V25_09180 [Mangrovibacterium sp.]